MTEKINLNDAAHAPLDAFTLEQRAGQLPAAMRGPFVWLGTYFRDDCDRDLDRLYSRFKALGFDHDKTTWSKILRGLWKWNASGTELASPCLSEEKFLKAVTGLQNDARIKELGGRVPIVLTPTVRRIHTYIDLKRAPDRVNKLGLIIGETGTQKTAACNEYLRLNNRGSDLVTRVDSPPKSSLGKFVRTLGRAYGFSAREPLARLENQLEGVINEKRILIVENIQRLYDERVQATRQPVFSYLQKLQEDSRCTLIFTLTPSFEKTMLLEQHRGFFEQFDGRAGGRKNFLRLDEYPTAGDVLPIARAFKLEAADKHVKELVALARQPGRIRTFFEVLQNAKIAAGEDKFTLHHIREELGTKVIAPENEEDK